MLSAIPDANQTFRQITYDVVSQQVENDVRPQVFFTNFPNLVLYTRDVVPGGGGWKDVLVADTRKPDAPISIMARRGRLILDRDKQTVDLVLEDGTRYSTPRRRRQAGRDLPVPARSLIVTLDPKSVFPRFELMRGHERADHPAAPGAGRGQADGNGMPAHQEMEAIQQRFSFPAACFVFAVIGVALGLTVARDGKLAGFVVGIAVIFAYYIFLYLAAGGHQGVLLRARAAARSRCCWRSSRAGCRTWSCSPSASSP